MSEQRKKRKFKETYQWLVSLAIVLAAAFALRTFVMCPVGVKGISMEPNFTHGNIVLVNRFIYSFKEPLYNDVIICDYSAATGEKHIIKRIIGVGGDVIDFQWTDNFYYNLVRNGEIVGESYINEKMYSEGDMTYPYTVPENCFFVMGDNRNESNDSRYKTVGAVEKDEIVGKVIVKLIPPEKIK